MLHTVRVIGLSKHKTYTQEQASQIDQRQHDAKDINKK